MPFLNGSLTVRPRDVDIHDLLNRERVHLDTRQIGDFLNGRVVMVTGAAGSIGSEICRQVLKYHPQRLVLLDNSENSLFFIETELRRLKPSAELVPFLASVSDARRLRVLYGPLQAGSDLPRGGAQACTFDGALSWGSDQEQCPRHCAFWSTKRFTRRPRCWS